jgi:ferredoxin-NADP reductase
VRAACHATPVATPNCDWPELFVAPRLLFISGGSGITPVLSMIRHLVATDYSGRIAWLHYAPNEVILGSEQASLAARCTRLRLKTPLPACARRAHASRASSWNAL